MRSLRLARTRRLESFIHLANQPIEAIGFFCETAPRRRHFHQPGTLGRKDFVLCHLRTGLGEFSKLSRTG